MRKLLYAFVFASILLLAGFTSFASENEPGGGGTVPEHQVWLPVVGNRSVPSECLMGAFVVRAGGLIGWWITVEEFLIYEYTDGMPGTWTGIVASEPDFREESILSSGPWDVLWLSGHGYGMFVVSVPSEYIQLGHRYYSRIEYECREYHVRMVSSAIAQ